MSLLAPLKPGFGFLGAKVEVVYAKYPDRIAAHLLIII
jgi:hypothetical protein